MICCLQDNNIGHLWSNVFNNHLYVPLKFHHMSVMLNQARIKDHTITNTTQIQHTQTTKYTPVLVLSPPEIFGNVKHLFTVCTTTGIHKVPIQLIAVAKRSTEQNPHFTTAHKRNKNDNHLESSYLYKPWKQFLHFGKIINLLNLVIWRLSTSVHTYTNTLHHIMSHQFGSQAFSLAINTKILCSVDCA